ncbi:hypothetical protein BCR39DRAFT_535231 [Naematelia encephala]|uniref:Uncharacterized protein n=1 Tax=Naematelia encephala TaxID=71784 RepID=A0A1Y2B0D9_9TREE|nr:hypothetical protein BCR39DRAFT_535231 [Naematelia encephala]
MEPVVNTSLLEATVKSSPLEPTVKSRPLATQDSSKKPLVALDDSTIRATQAAIHSGLPKLATPLANVRDPGKLVDMLKGKLVETSPQIAQFLLYKLDFWLTKRPAWVEVYCKCMCETPGDVVARFVFGGRIDMGDGQGADELEIVNAVFRVTWEGGTEVEQQAAQRGKWVLKRAIMELANKPTRIKPLDHQATPSPPRRPPRRPSSTSSYLTVPSTHTHIQTPRSPNPTEITPSSEAQTQRQQRQQQQHRRTKARLLRAEASQSESNTTDLLVQLVRTANQVRLKDPQSPHGIPSSLIEPHLGHTYLEVARQLLPDPERKPRWASMYCTYQEADLNLETPEMVVCLKYSGFAQYREGQDGVAEKGEQDELAEKGEQDERAEKGEQEGDAENGEKVAREGQAEEVERNEEVGKEGREAKADTTGNEGQNGQNGQEGQADKGDVAERERHKEQVEDSGEELKTVIVYLKFRRTKKEGEGDKSGELIWSYAGRRIQARAPEEMKSKQQT